MPKKQAQRSARAICEELGFDVVRHAVGIIRTPGCPVDIQVDILKLLFPHVHEKLDSLQIIHEGIAESTSVTQQFFMQSPEARRHIEDAMILQAQHVRETRRLEARQETIDVEGINS